MRALVVAPGPDFSVQDVYEGWVKGLSGCGISVARLNLNERLNFYSEALLERDGDYVKAFSSQGVVRMAANGIKSCVYDWWPDAIFIVSAFFVPLDFYPVFKARGQKVVLIHTESPYEDDRQLERAQYADLNIINDPTNLDRFREVAPTIYIPHGYDPDRHHPRPSEPELASDFCFVGTGYPSRVGFFEQVDFSGLDATFAGHWQSLGDASPLRPLLAHPPDVCCPNEDTVRLYASTKMSANVYRREAQRPELSEGWAMSPREVELAACGVPFLRESRGESDEVLSVLPTFGSPEEFGDLLRWWIAHDDERDAAAKAARLAVLPRTFQAHAEQALAAVA